jgi:HEAT repeat protein
MQFAITSTFIIIHIAPYALRLTLRHSVDFARNIVIIYLMKKYLPLALLVILMCGVPPLQQAHMILQNGTNDESAIIRINAAKGYALINETEGVQILYEELKKEDKNGIVAALSALYDLGETRYSPVIGQLATHTDPLIRAEAYRVLAQIKAPECHEILLQGINDKVAKIRRFSYAGLEKYEDMKALRNGLQDSDLQVKIAAARALGRLGDERASNVIRGAMQTIHAEIWHDGILALAEIGDTSAQSFIEEQLNDTPWEIRLAAAEACIILKCRDVTDVLEQGLASSNPFVRVATVMVLKERRPAEGRVMLETAVKDDYINVSIVAIEALSDYRTKEYAPLFIEMMNAPNPLVKIAAATAYVRTQ